MRSLETWRTPTIAWHQPRSILALLAGAFAMCALPGSAAATSAGWTGQLLIREVTPREFGLDVFVPGITSDVGCPNTQWVRLSLNAANYTTILSVILDNARNHREMRFWINACDTDGTSLLIAADTSVW